MLLEWILIASCIGSVTALIAVGVGGEETGVVGTAFGSGCAETVEAEVVEEGVGVEGAEVGVAIG